MGCSHTSPRRWRSRVRLSRSPCPPARAQGSAPSALAPVPIRATSCLLGTTGSASGCHEPYSEQFTPRISVHRRRGRVTARGCTTLSPKLISKPVLTLRSCEGSPASLAPPSAFFFTVPTCLPNLSRIPSIYPHLYTSQPMAPPVSPLSLSPPNYVPFSSTIMKQSTIPVTTTSFPFVSSSALLPGCVRSALPLTSVCETSNVSSATEINRVAATSLQYSDLSCHPCLSNTTTTPNNHFAVSTVPSNQSTISTTTTVHPIPSPSPSPRTELPVHLSTSSSISQQSLSLTAGTVSTSCHTTDTSLQPSTSAQRSTFYRSSTQANMTRETQTPVFSSSHSSYTSTTLTSCTSTTLTSSSSS